MMSLFPVASSASAVGGAGAGQLNAGRAVSSGQLNDRAGVAFGEILTQLAGGAMENLKTAEAASIIGVRGQLPTQDVVEAVLNAEKTLQTAVAVRDKVVAAYLDLSRMAI